MDFYCYTDQSRKMKHDPNTNKIIWEDIRLPSAIRLHQVNGLLDALKAKDYTQILKIYYQTQHLHTLNVRENPIYIPVYIHHDQVEKKWVPHVKYSIEAINEATPGINHLKQAIE